MNYTLRSRFVQLDERIDRRPFSATALALSTKPPPGSHESGWVLGAGYSYAPCQRARAASSGLIDYIQENPRQNDPRPSRATPGLTHKPPPGCHGSAYVVSIGEVGTEDGDNFVRH